MTTFTLNSFLAQLRMSKQHHVVVEGKEDREFVLNLRAKFNLPQRMVYPASEMKGGFSDPKNNRKKVEEIALRSSKFIAPGCLSCLVDREFREFDLQRGSDKIGLHHVVNFTYWTIGHSFENYFFDPDILVGGFSGLTSAYWHRSADSFFIHHFDYFSQLAASLSLADFEVNRSGFSIGLRPAVSDLIRVEDTELAIDFSGLETLVSARLDPQSAALYQASFRRAFCVMRTIRPSELRRLIRGHTGVALFQAFYAWSLEFTAPRVLDRNYIGARMSEILESSSETVFKGLLRSYLRFLEVVPCRRRLSAQPMQFLLR